MINQSSKKIFIETYGCQMNEYDTELVRSILLKENFAFTKSEREADVIMLNTCAIRENAHRKVYGRVHDIHHRRDGKPVMIGILGCMATNLRQELFETRNLKIDFIAGPDSYKRLPELIRQAAETGEKAYDVTLSEFETYSDVSPALTPGVYPDRHLRVNAWIAVMRGCNNFCTFCVVPYTRGRERSRSVENVVEEVKRLADEGFKQVTLLGQNVNSYQYEQDDFANLLEAVSKVNGIERIRFTSPHPKDFPQRLLEVIVNNPKVCKTVHMPLQAGNDRVLDLMNRNYTQKEYLDLVDKVRSMYPSMMLTTDVIVGFPTETDAEFEDTMKVIRTVEFDMAFMFKYSERKNTVASHKYQDDVPPAIKTERITRLVELQKEITFKRNRMHIGQVERILLESPTTDRMGSDLPGRTDGGKLVVIHAGGYKIGDFVDVKITDATPHVLRGEPINSPAFSD